MMLTDGTSATISPTAPRRLKKELNLMSVYALATGATLSSFFLLPGIAYEQAGPAVVLSFLIAVLPLVPALFSSVELATALPRAGGAYYFLDRSMGPLVGTIGGIGTWLALMLKTAFALIGMGAYINLYLPELPIIPVAVVFAVIFAGTNLLGARKTVALQVFLVIILLAITGAFVVAGVPEMERARFDNFFNEGGVNSMLSTAGVVFIGYIGVTKVSSVSEEVQDPERNLPLGMFMGMFTAVLVYVVGTFVMVGVMPPELLSGSLHPVATAAEIIGGKWGAAFVTVAALFSFFAVANAGILSASRYPLAMSRDHLLPRIFRKFNQRDMPSVGIYATLAVIVLTLIFLDPTKIAKLASAFQLLLFGLLCGAVIVMRESGLASYDPGYRSPFYPWMQVFGIVTSLLLIMEMGPLPILFSTGLIAVGVCWYFYYVRGRVSRQGAIFHVFERWGHQRYDPLDRELRGILKEKGARTHDLFEEVVIRSTVLDLRGTRNFVEITRQASAHMAERLGMPAEELAHHFLEGTGVGATPVARGAALPHLRLAGIEKNELVMVRTSEGVDLEVEGPAQAEIESDEPIYAIFYLTSPLDDPARHLRILAELATRIDDPGFMSEWMTASDDHELKEILLHDERFISLELRRDSVAGEWIGTAVCDLQLPKGCIVASVRRGGEALQPEGETVLHEGDWITILGDPDPIRKIAEGHHGEPDEGEAAK